MSTGSLDIFLSVSVLSSRSRQCHTASTVTVHTSRSPRFPVCRNLSPNSQVYWHSFIRTVPSRSIYRFPGDQGCFPLYYSDGGWRFFHATSIVRNYNQLYAFRRVTCVDNRTSPGIILRLESRRTGIWDRISTSPQSSPTHQFIGCHLH